MVRRLTDQKHKVKDQQQEKLNSVFESEDWEKITLSQIIEKVLQQKNMKPAEVYNAIDMDAKTFQRIYNGVSQRPALDNVIMTGIGLELTTEELQKFLRKAGWNDFLDKRINWILELTKAEKTVYDINSHLRREEMKELGPCKNPEKLNKNWCKMIENRP